jgi:hypothetical protein
MDLILNQKLEKLIKGQAVFKSHNLGFNLLISRLQKKYAENSSKEVLADCVQEINAFCSKYSSIMANEIETIKKL